MCMEDVRIGRESQSTIKGFVCTTSLVQIAPASPRRICLVLSAPNTGNITYSFDSNSVIGQGINMTAGQDPFEIYIQTHGDMVRRNWYVRGAVGGELIGVVETLLTKE